jgi:hypothetical protein
VYDVIVNFFQSQRRLYKEFSLCLLKYPDQQSLNDLSTISLPSTAMVWELIRDSAFGHCVRIVTKGRVFQYPEEADGSLWKKYVNKEKSGYQAHHGTLEPYGNESREELQNIEGVRTREADGSEATLPNDGNHYNEASGIPVDPEKGRDKHVIDWYGPDDPGVSFIS